MRFTLAAQNIAAGGDSWPQQREEKHVVELWVFLRLPAVRYLLPGIIRLPPSPSVSMLFPGE